MGDLLLKRCSLCHEHKSLDCFARDKNRRDGLDPQCRECKKAYWVRHKEKLQEHNHHYAKTHREEINERRRLKRDVYEREKRTTDINYRLRDNLRSRLCHAIKRNQKGGSAVKDLGCTIEELKNYLEEQFQPDMSWDNWGRNTWHIDHIIPLSLFDLSNREQFLKAVHYTNLQPLRVEDHFIKTSHDNKRIY